MTLARPKKLTIGRGFNQRLTKAGREAEARFEQLAAECIKALGGKPNEGSPHTWTIETIAGTLRLWPTGSTIFCRFDDPARAKACPVYFVSAFVNPFSGKWNHHYAVGAGEREIEGFRAQLACIVVKKPDGAPSNEAKET